MKRMLVVLSVLLLSGCASYGSYRYVERSGGGDYYYDRYDHGHARYTYHGYPFDVTYAYYPYYYSLFWGFRNHYYDPFFSPGFHYGVTWFPRTWFSFSLGHHDWGHYHAYAPWRYSFWDGYYSWNRATWRGRSGYFPTAYTPRFGSARNEAERLASLRTQSRGGVRTALPMDKSGNLVLGTRGRSAAATRGSARDGVMTQRGPSTSGGRAPAARSASGAVQRRVAPARSPGTVRGQRAAPPSARAEPSRSHGTWTAEPRYGGAAPHPRSMAARRADAAGANSLRGDSLPHRTAAPAPRSESGVVDRQPWISPDLRAEPRQASQPRDLRLEAPAPRHAPISAPRGNVSIPTTATAPAAAPARSAPVFAPAPPSAPAPVGRSSGDRMAPRDGGGARRGEGFSRDRR